MLRYDNVVLNEYYYYYYYYYHHHHHHHVRLLKRSQTQPAQQIEHRMDGKQIEITTQIKELEMFAFLSFPVSM